MAGNPERLPRQTPTARGSGAVGLVGIHNTGRSQMAVATSAKTKARGHGTHRRARPRRLTAPRGKPYGHVLVSCPSVPPTLGSVASRAAKLETPGPALNSHRTPTNGPVNTYASHATPAVCRPFTQGRTFGHVTCLASVEGRA